MLETVDLHKQLSRPAYTRRIAQLQEELRSLQYAARDAAIPVVICLEGWDSAGKGLVIKKLSEKLDPRLFRVYPGSAPTALEQRYHFLWRYQVRLPNDGEVALFDHSWYGRVLVERCDKLTKKKVWRQAYEQISEFERWLTDDGQVLVKFFLHISKAEQKARFRAAEKDPLLKWKITKEYRRHHRDYSRWLKAVEEMIAKTDTAYAPWSVIEANDLRWARVRVFEILVARMREQLARHKALAAAAARPAAAASPGKKQRAASAASGKAARAENKSEEKKTVTMAGNSGAEKAEAAHA